MLTHTLSLILVIIFIASVIKYLLHVKFFFNRIESKYPDLWLSMGMPRLNFQFGDTRYRKAMRYIRKHEFRDLEDAVLEREYKKIIFLERVGLVIFIALLGLSIYPAM
ncbi:MAG: hypothetical protein U9N52_03595 [Campylobacterota bacterium]|nr:hypothetical protein [Campylobacterota bacterium]